MILPIYTYGQGVLKKEAEEIDSSYEGLPQLIQDMYETLRKSEGVGLAAPQVGLSIRLVVVDLDVISEESSYPGGLVIACSMDPAFRLWDASKDLGAVAICGADLTAHLHGARHRLKLVVEMFDCPDAFPHEVIFFLGSGFALSGARQTAQHFDTAVEICKHAVHIKVDLLYHFDHFLSQIV